MAPLNRKKFLYFLLLLLPFAIFLSLQLISYTAPFSPDRKEYRQDVRNGLVQELMHLANENSGEQYNNDNFPTTEILVKLRSNSDPDLIASELGLVNLGQVGPLEDYFVFDYASLDLKTLLSKSSDEYVSSVGCEDKITKECSAKILIAVMNERIHMLEMLPQVISAEHQIIRKQQKKNMVNLAALPDDPGFSQQWWLKNTGQLGGTPGVDINAVKAWDDSIIGRDVVISVVDDGVQYSHPDLKDSYLSEYSWDFNGNDANPLPEAGDDHGTSCAGCVMANKNSVCGVGAAYGAKFAAIRLISDGVTAATEANAETYKYEKVDIYSNSWGPDDNGKTQAKISNVLKDALKQGVTKGRGNKGNIYLWAAGNGRASGDRCSYDGYSSNRFAICVGGIGNLGEQTSASESCPALFVVAPSSNIYTTDRTGANGYGSGDCFDNFGGTSAATPIVAGVVALMLEANSDLTQRDVIHILANKARSDIGQMKADANWARNTAGYYHSENYGFGLVDSGEYVKVAKEWKQKGIHAGPQKDTVISPLKTLNKAIPDGNSNGITDSIALNCADKIALEHIEVEFKATHPNRGQLYVALTSPSGIVSTFSEQHQDSNNNIDLTFTSVRNWGESCTGSWTLKVADMVSGSTGTWNSWSITAYTYEPREDTLSPGDVAGIIAGVALGCIAAAAVFIGYKRPDLYRKACAKVKSANKGISKAPWNKVTSRLHNISTGKTKSKTSTPTLQSNASQKYVAPSPVAPCGKTTAIVLFDFTSSAHDELNLNKGENIVILNQTGDWWMAEARGKTGLIPSNYVKLAAPVKPNYGRWKESL